MHNESIEQTPPVRLSRRQFLRTGTSAALELRLPAPGWLTGHP